MRAGLILPLVVALLAPSSARAQQTAAGAAQSGAGGYHAPVIGNNEYRALPKLKTAEADAREVAALLKEFYGFETTLLVNATRQQIVSALSGFGPPQPQPPRRHRQRRPPRRRRPGAVSRA